MQVNKQTFEYEKCIVEVEYTKLPTKDDLEEACVRFLKKAMQELKDKESNNK